MGDTTTITVTFGEQVENHARMQMIGALATRGFTVADLKAAKAAFEAKKEGMVCELLDLNAALPPSTVGEEAAILIVRGGVDLLLGERPEGPATGTQLLAEHKALIWDAKAKMYGRVVNKHARHNLCYADFAQEPDYENGKGRVVDFAALPLTRWIRAALPLYVGEEARGLLAEGNLYFDPSKCGIGWHGDSERKKVIALRLGYSLPLQYHWFLQGSPIGETVKAVLHHGDLYIMSEKAVGQDWKKRNIPTLRHAAGAPKFLKLD